MKNNKLKENKTDYVNLFFTILFIIVIIFTWIYKPHQRIEFVEICKGVVTDENDYEIMYDFGFSEDNYSILKVDGSRQTRLGSE